MCNFFLMPKIVEIENQHLKYIIYNINHVNCADPPLMQSENYHNIIFEI